MMAVGVMEWVFGFAGALGGCVVAKFVGFVFGGWIARRLFVRKAVGGWCWGYCRVC